MKGRDPNDAGERKPERRMTRRSALVGLAVLGGGALGLRVRSQQARLRPPGAVADGDFERRCIRCLRCAVVCPVKAIRFDGSLDLSGAATPYIDARDRGCVLCMKCTEACPSGALEPIDSDPELVHAKVRMGRPRLDRDACLAWNGGGECRACYYVCPYPDSAVRLDGTLLAPVFDAESCVGCGLCEEACPDRARAVAILPERA